MGLRSADSSFTSTGAAQWNEIIYTKIAILGDSSPGQPPMFDTTWPELLQNRLNAAGGKVQIRNFSTFSHSFFRANTVATYGSLTAVQAVIGYKPDIIIVELGANDAIGSALAVGDNRTLTQIQSDATTTYTDLVAGLPSAVFIQVKWLLYDTSNFTTSNVKNKGITPRLITRKSAGILSGLETSEYLDDNVSSANRGVLDTYDSLHTTIAAIANVNVLTANLFRVERLGVNLPDRVHYNAVGHAIIAAYIKKGLAGISAFTALVPNIAEQVDIDQGEDPDDLFTDYLVASSDGYVDNTPGVAAGETVTATWVARGIHPENWFMDYKATCVLSASTYYNSFGVEGTIYAAIADAARLTTVQYSFDGAAFANSSTVTDGNGNALFELFVGPLNLSNAAHDLRIKIGQSVFLFSITIAANVIGNVNTTAVGNVGAGEDNLITHIIPAGFVFAAAGRGIHVVQHGTQANNAAAKSLRLYFGTTVLGGGALGLVANLAGDWEAEWWCYSTGEDTQAYFGTITIPLTAATSWTLGFSGTSAQDDDATIVVKCTGQATNDNDIIQTSQRVYYE